MELFWRPWGSTVNPLRPRWGCLSRREARGPGLGPGEVHVEGGRCTGEWGKVRAVNVRFFQELEPMQTAHCLQKKQGRVLCEKTVPGAPMMTSYI